MSLFIYIEIFVTNFFDFLLFLSLEVEEEDVEETTEVDEDVEDTIEFVEYANSKSESELETSSFPVGWTAWKSHGVKSPEGTKYLTKGKAIINLTKLGGSSETVEVLRALYVADGFTEAGLPNGWMGKKKIKDYIFITPEGFCVHSKAKAIIHLIENGSSKEEQSMIDQFCQGLSNKKHVRENLKKKVVPRKRVRNRNVSLGEEIAIIPGWKTWGGQGLTSPEGTNFESKARAIKHLVNTGGALETIQALRTLYEAQHYTSENLPEGWMGRKNTKGFSFISPAGHFLKGKVKAIEYLSKITSAEEDHSKITTFNIGLPKSERYSTDWEASEYLPEGWMGRMNSDSVGILQQRVNSLTLLIQLQNS